jgi:hypothetical protein
MVVGLAASLEDSEKYTELKSILNYCSMMLDVLNFQSLTDWKMP